MSTRSYIGVYNADKDTVDYIYCHYDGYLSYVGRLLVEHYTDEAKARALVALGDISQLGVNLSASDEPVEQTRYVRCVRAYHRDCREPLNINHARLAEYLREEGDVQYVYLYKDAQWFVVVGQSFVPVIDCINSKASG